MRIKNKSHKSYKYFGQINLLPSNRMYIFINNDDDDVSFYLNRKVELLKNVDPTDEVKHKGGILKRKWKLKMNHQRRTYNYLRNVRSQLEELILVMFTIYILIPSSGREALNILLLSNGNCVNDMIFILFFV